MNNGAAYVVKNLRKSAQSAGKGKYEDLEIRKCF